MVKLDQIGKKNQDEGDKGPELITEIEPYTEEDLKAAWMSYVDNLDEIKNSAEFRLLNKAYEYSNNMAEILIDNPIEEDVFKEIKTEFITNIRRRLRNKNFDIRLKIDQSEKKKIIYTPHDKFEHLAEKYPAMRELKQRLGLEFEF
jgi:DNA polymerase-3 subunit gamma/tau